MLSLTVKTRREYLCRMLKKTVQEVRRTLRYVEPLSEARTKLAAFFSILLLYEQQAGGANLFPGGRTEEDFKLLDGTWKCGFCFPE
jgi:hypothetical protein